MGPASRCEAVRLLLVTCRAAGVAGVRAQQATVRLLQLLASCTAAGGRQLLHMGSAGISSSG
jgi:hypothetical protein